MHRRNFLASGLTLSAAAAGAPLAAPLSALGQLPIPPAGHESEAAPRPGMPGATGAHEFYDLRKYTLTSGPGTTLTENYFAQALIPALIRLGFGPIGAFRLDVGPETPSFYLLIPANSVEALTTVELQLAGDGQFLQAAEPFYAAPATAPAFHRIESSLLRAFPGWPRLTPPLPSPKRLLQLRTYESPSHRDHVRKVEMFHHGEFDIFRSAGFHQVFYGDALIGPRLPNLTYMLSFPDQSALDAAWDRFRADPAWQKLSHDPRYSFEQIVSNITNLILSPLACSQI